MIFSLGRGGLAEGEEMQHAGRAARRRAGGPPRLVRANGNINHPMGMGTSDERLQTETQTE